jgi:capsular exopolysaccharide synthesis family protein
VELRDYLRGLRRHWLAVLLMTLVGVATAFGWYLIQTPVYEATAIGLVQTRTVAVEGDENQNLVSNPAYDSYAGAKVPTYIDMATWKTVADGAVESLGIDEPVAQVVSRITIDNTPDTNIIQITAQAGSSEDALALAEAWMASLVAAIDEFEGDGTPGSAPVTITMDQSAVVPTTPVYPDLQTSLIVGGVLGLGVGIAFALMRTASDRRIRAADDVESRTGLPVIGTIPLTSSPADSRLFDAGAMTDKGTRFAVAEALRALRTNLQFMDVDNPPRTIVVTSPLPSDGKSTIACNLALTLAASGRAVVLVDGDLRRSTVAATMGLPGGAGLSDVLSGRAEIADVLQRTPQSPNLFVLTAGSVPPNPSEVLGSARMHQLVGDLAKHAMVIIDAPPLLPVTDGAVLTHQSDGALLVVSLGKTTYDLLEKAVDTLTKAGGRALGVVLNRAPLRGIDSSTYAYEYRREYTSADKLGGAAAVIEDPHADFNLDGVFPAAVPPEPEPAPEPARASARPRARRS